MKILITGANGFVGKNLVRYLIDHLQYNPRSILTPSRYVLDCTRQDSIELYFDFYKPDIVIHLAGKVGGVKANKNAMGDFFYQNAIMSIMLMEECRKRNVKKFIGLAAGCGYPNNIKPPYIEEDFFSGFPEKSSYGYSMAKKNLVIQGLSYKEQYGFNSTILLPANLYGPHDNFNLEECHVVPALVRKFVEAKRNGLPTVEVWGSGLATRDFLYVGDIVKAIVQSFDVDEVGPFNVGSGTETSIKELAETIKDVVDFKGEIRYQRGEPEGQERRYYDMSNFENVFGYIPNTSLRDGLEKTVEWYQHHV